MVLVKETYGRQFFDFSVRGSQGGETDLLRELGEAGVGQQRDVAKEFVDAVTGNNKQR